MMRIVVAIESRQGRQLLVHKQQKKNKNATLS